MQTSNVQNRVCYKLFCFGFCALIICICFVLRIYNFGFLFSYILSVIVISLLAVFDLTVDCLFTKNPAYKKAGFLCC